jgi:predicted GNAT family acetyltransferase
MKSKTNKKLPRNWKDLLRIEETKYKNHDVEYNLYFTKKIVGYKEQIGYLTISRKGKLNIVRVASIELNMRGKGCGKMLYEHAIKQLGSLTTDYHKASNMAQLLWKRLVQLYRHKMDFFTGQLTVFKK